jgi:hypothetical protein
MNKWLPSLVLHSALQVVLVVWVIFSISFMCWQVQELSEKLRSTTNSNIFAKLMIIFIQANDLDYQWYYIKPQCNTLRITNQGSFFSCKHLYNLLVVCSNFVLIVIKVRLQNVHAWELNFFFFKFVHVCRLSLLVHLNTIQTFYHGKK